MSTEPTPVRAGDLRRTDVAWCREGGRFAVVSGLRAIPGTGEVEITFLDGEGEERERCGAAEEVLLKRRGVNAERVIERLCVPPGERAGAWRTERRADHTFHAGFLPLGDGPEFVAALGAWVEGGHIRLLPDGGEFPYSFSLADDLGLAMIDYSEGDIGVRAFDEPEAYIRALDLYARGALESSEHERKCGPCPANRDLPRQRGVREPMRRAELTKSLRAALLDDAEQAKRARAEVHCQIGGLDLGSEERHVARGEGGYALQTLCEELCGLPGIGEASEPGAGALRAVLLRAALEEVDFEEIADELIGEIEEGVLG